METEYQRNFRGLLAPPTEPCPQKHLEHHQRTPLFHTHTADKKRSAGPEKKPRPIQDNYAPNNDKTTPPPPPPQVQRGHRIPEGGGATDGDAHQVEELRQKASLYRRRAWGANFDRAHLSQLLSEHNTLWEPADSTADPPTPRLTSDLCTNPLDALHLDSRSSQTSSVTSAGNKNTQIKAQTPPSPPAESRTAWREEEEEEEEEEDTDDEEGRLPTPRLKIRPVQRTHHDLTTPATGGAILVGKLKSSDYKQRWGSAVSVADVSVKQKEAWSENSPTPSSSSGAFPNHKPAASPASKQIRTKPTPLVAPPPQHCIQGTLRKADFQHNGELGLRFRELQCPGGRGGGCSDEDDRLSVMSWRSAASCSAASAVLERAQKRQEHFWGKR